MTDETRYTGKIIFVDYDKGFGFVTTPEIKFKRIFFHWDAFPPENNFEDVKKGMTISFQTKDFPDKGLRAIKVQVVKDNGT